MLSLKLIHASERWDCWNQGIVELLYPTETPIPYTSNITSMNKFQW